MNKEQEDYRITERTTRLGIVIIVFSALWYLFKGSLKIWFKTFSEFIVVKSYFHIGSLLSILVLTITFFITYSVVKYMYFELKAFQHFDNKEEKKKILKEAEESFTNIFQCLKTSFIATMLMLALVCLTVVANSGSTFQKYEIYAVFIGIPLLMFTLNLIEKHRPLKIRESSKFKKISSFSDRLASKLNFLGPYSNFIVTFGLVYIFGVALTVVALEEDKPMSMKLNETTDIPLEIKLQSISDPSIYIEIKNSNLPHETTNFMVRSSQMERSSIEVIEMDANGEFKNKIKEESWRKIERLSLKESKYFYEYTTKLKNHIGEGKNELKVVIFPKGKSTLKKTIINTTIYKKGNEIDITKKSFNI